MAPGFEQLEAQGRLPAAASEEIDVLHGWRIGGTREPARAALLQVAGE